MPAPSPSPPRTDRPPRLLTFAPQVDEIKAEPLASPRARSPLSPPPPNPYGDHLPSVGRPPNSGLSATSPPSTRRGAVAGVRRRGTIAGDHLSAGSQSPRSPGQPRSHKDRLRDAAEGAAAAKLAQKAEARRKQRASSFGGRASVASAGSPASVRGGTGRTAPAIWADDDQDDLDAEAEGAQTMRDDWAMWRNTLRLRLFGTGYLDKLVIGVILANSIALAFEEHGPGASTPPVLKVLDVIFTIFYGVEFVLKVLGLGFWGQKESYFGYFKVIEATKHRKGLKGAPEQRLLRLNWWNMLDFVVMITGLLALLIPVLTSTDPEGGPLGGLRVFRLLRPLKAVNALPEMRVLMRSILQSLPRLLNMLILFCLLLVTMGIMSVQIFKGLLRQRCFPLEWIDPGALDGMEPRDAESMGLVCARNATDSHGERVGPKHAEGRVCPWGFTCLTDSGNYANRGKVHFDNIGSALLGLTVSVTLEGWTDLMYSVMDASILYTCLFFVILVILGAFFVMNLTIVIVNNVFEYNLLYEGAKMQQLQAAQEARRKDETRTVDMIRWPKHMDATGKVGWRRGILGMVSQKGFDTVMFLVILGNIASLGAWHHGQTYTFAAFLHFCNLVFTFMFVLEAALKLLGHGVRGYFSVNWNVFDFMIVLVSVVQMALENPFAPGDGTSKSSLKTLQVFRAIQVVRVLKLTRQSRRLQRWARVCIEAIKATLTLTMLLALIVFIYALLGTQLFAGRLCGLAADRDLREDLPKWYRGSTNATAAPGSAVTCNDIPRTNFEHAGRSALALFIVLSGEDWQFIMYDCMAGAGDWASAYFISWYFIGNNLLLNLFISILIARVTEVRQEDEELEAHQKQWKNAKRSRSMSRSMGRSMSVVSVGEDPAGSLEGETPTWLGRLLQPVQPLASCVRGEYERLTQTRLARALSPCREQLCVLVQHNAFETVIMVLILISCVTLALYSPLRAPDEPIEQVLSVIDQVNTFCFIGEAALKILAFGFVFGESTYLQRDNWNRLDFFIVVSSIIPLVIPGDTGSLSNMKILRIMRVLRPLRFINKSKELKVALASLFSAIPSLGMVMVLGFLGWLVFAILGVQLFGGTFYACSQDSWNDVPSARTKQACLNLSNGTDGPAWRNYESHFDHAGFAFLTLFELASLEGWVEVMHVAIDSVSHDAAPVEGNRPFVALYFVGFVLLGAIFIVNLFVSALVDAFQDQRRSEGASGFLTDDQQDWVTMRKLLFRHLRPPIHADPVKGIPRWRRCAVIVVAHPLFEGFINLAVVLNVLTLATEHYNEAQEHLDAADLINNIFVVLFTLEALLKIAAFTPRLYLVNPWNRFDLFIVIISVVGIIVASITKPASGASEVEGSADIGGVASVFRALRLLRLLRLLNAAKGVQALLRTLFLTLPTMMNLSGIMLLLLFCYAVLGVFLFGRTEHGDYLNGYATFESIPMALLLLTRIATGEAWPGVMHDCTRENPGCEILDMCGPGGATTYAYFVSYVVLVMYVFLNLFIAVLLDSFNDAVDIGEQLVTDEEMEHFFDVWREFDPLQSCTIDFGDMTDFLKAIGPPLGPPQDQQSDHQIVKNYISQMKEVDMVQGRIHQDRVVSTLFRIAYKNATGNDLTGKLLQEFEENLSQAMQSKFRDRIIKEGKDIEVRQVREHPFVEKHMVVWIQAVIRGRLARLRVKGPRPLPADAERMQLGDSRRWSDSSAASSSVGSALSAQLAPRRPWERWDYATEDSAATSSSARPDTPADGPTGGAGAVLLAPSPRGWPGAAPTGEYSTATPLRGRRGRRGLGPDPPPARGGEAPPPPPEPPPQGGSPPPAGLPAPLVPAPPLGVLLPQAPPLSAAALIALADPSPAPTDASWAAAGGGPRPRTRSALLWERHRIPTAHVLAGRRDRGCGPSAPATAPTAPLPPPPPPGAGAWGDLQQPLLAVHEASFARPPTFRLPLPGGWRPAAAPRGRRGAPPGTGGPAVPV